MSSLDSVKVEISVLVGRSVISIQRLLRMGRGAVIELDSTRDALVLILANNRPVATGKIQIEGENIRVCVCDLIPYEPE